MRPVHQACSVTARTSGKAPLPEKICKRCGRPFCWRKKWAEVWSEVSYCSARCRRDGDADPYAGFFKQFCLP